MYEINKVYITDPGDPSVGIPATDWIIEGYMMFDDKKEMEKAREALIDAWEFICGERVKVMFDFELDEMDLEKED